MRGNVKSFHLLLNESIQNPERPRATKRTTCPDEFSKQIFRLGMITRSRKLNPSPISNSSFRVHQELGSVLSVGAALNILRQILAASVEIICRSDGHVITSVLFFSYLRVYLDIAKYYSLKVFFL